MQQDEGLAYVEGISKKASKLFVSILLGCLYAWVTIGTTRDARLLTNAVSSPLPIVQAEIPIVGFYSIAPIILVAFYVYFHLYLQRLWKQLADLPPVFPDGKPLDEKAYPWLLPNSLVRAHVDPLRETRTLLSRLEVAISVFMAWWVVPVTLIAFWGRYLPRHDWVGTSLHVVLASIAIVCALWCRKLAKTTLRHQQPASIRFKGNWTNLNPYKEAIQRTHPALIGAIFFSVAAIFSWGAINGVKLNEGEQIRGEQLKARLPMLTTEIKRIIPKVLPYFGLRAYADLVEQNVSAKPLNWFLRDDTELTRIVNGAQLKGMDLRYVSARKAFLVNADLRGARLEKADLQEAQLQKANLSGANLEQAFLRGAQLQSAILQDAHLQNVDLSWANLQDTDLSNAPLQGINLYRAKLQNVNLRGAQLQKANLGGGHLDGANLSGANLEQAFLRGAQLQKANLSGANLQQASLAEANLQQADLRFAQLQKAHLRAVQLQEADMYGAQLQEADLSGADLEKVKGLTQEQIDLACVNRLTKLPSHLKRPTCFIELILPDLHGGY